jgi:hypothetical protein
LLKKTGIVLKIDGWQNKRTSEFVESVPGGNLV